MNIYDSELSNQTCNRDTKGHMSDALNQISQPVSYAYKLFYIDYSAMRKPSKLVQVITDNHSHLPYIGLS